jgi:hypothetical protein
MVWTEPLNLEYWFVNVLSGSPNIFIFIAFLSIATVAAFFRMLNSAVMIMFLLFAVIMSGFVNVSGIYLIIILLAGLITAYSISKIVK